MLISQSLMKTVEQLKLHEVREDTSSLQEELSLMKTVEQLELHEVREDTSSLQEELCSPADTENWNLGLSDNIFGFLFKRCHPQVYGHLLHRPHGSC